MPKRRPDPNVHEHGSRPRTWRDHAASVNFGYILFAMALIWLGGSAYLAR